MVTQNPYVSQERACFLVSPSIYLHATVTIRKWCQTPDNTRVHFILGGGHGVVSVCLCICVSGFVTSGLEPEPAFLSIIVYSAVPAESLLLSFYVVFIIRINLFFPLLVWCHCPWSRVHLLCDSVFFLSLFFCALFSPCFSFSIFSPPLSVRAWGEEKTSSRQDRTSQWKVWNRSG